FYMTRELVNQWESAALSLSGMTAVMEMSVMVPGHAIAAGLRFIPDFTVGGAGFGGSPVAHAEIISGDKIAGAVGDGLAAVQAMMTSLDKLANIASTLGSYVRRKEDWDFQ